jgi:uncharacterized membrane protein YdbT with pleckstrin-like domain
VTAALDPLPHPEDAPEEVLFEGHPALVPSLGALLVAVLTLGIALVFFAIRQKSVHYRLTSERIVVEEGLFSKRMDQIDIYRINDYVVDRPFGQRLLGTGNLVLTAMDRTTPELRIHGLKTDVVALYERLRKATETEKRRRGVRLVDYE